MKMMQKFRTIYQTAIDNGWVQKNPFASIKIHFDVVNREFLTKQELVDIIQKPMTSKRLDQVRDVFVFCCFCGLAYCDVAELTTDNLVDGDDGRTWLRTRRQKTDTPVDVPLLEIPMTILRKYDGQITGDKLLPESKVQRLSEGDRIDLRNRQGTYVPHGTAHILDDRDALERRTYRNRLENARTPQYPHDANLCKSYSR